MNFFKQRRLNRLERNVIQAAKVWSGSFKYHSDAEAAERVLLKAVKKLVKYEKENEEDTSKWYNCAHCDAGYPDQECTCNENEE
jgi:hypothetical protein